MNGWAIPAPAPWANTKHARALSDRSSSAKTEVPFSKVSFNRWTVIRISPRRDVEKKLHHSEMRPLWAQTRNPEAAYHFWIPDSSPADRAARGIRPGMTGSYFA